MAWQDFQKEPTESLIEFIQWKDDPAYVTAAQEAFHAFCFRFSKDVIKKCRIICGRWGYDFQISDIIAERTFDRFWKYPKTFNPTKCKKDIDNCAKFYLYRIAQHQLADYKKEESDVNLATHSGDEQIITEFPDIDSLNIPGDAKRELKRKQDIVDKAMARLTPKHKIIYLTYKTHEIEGRKMPRQLLKNLRTELDLAQASLQVYKKEANDKINEYLAIYGSK